MRHHLPERLQGTRGNAPFTKQPTSTYSWNRGVESAGLTSGSVSWYSSVGGRGGQDNWETGGAVRKVPEGRSYKTLWARPKSTFPPRVRPQALSHPLKDQPPTESLGTSWFLEVNLLTHHLGLACSLWKRAAGSGRKLGIHSSIPWSRRAAAMRE